MFSLTHLIYGCFLCFRNRGMSEENISAEGYSENGFLIGPLAYVTFDFGE